MDINFEKKYHQLEKSHWWFRKRRELVLEWMSKFQKDAVILDIGCSSGALLSDLRERGYQNLYGIDLSENAVALAQEHGHQNAQVMDAGSITFEAEKFDVLIASDCLEHISDDEVALDHWFRILKPGGTLILFVPAFMFLWSVHDEVNHHQTRYTKTQIATRIKGAGFQIQRIGFWNFFLFPGIVLARFLQRLLPASKRAVDDLHQPPVIINKALSGIIHIENVFLKYIDLPIGISAYAVAQKPVK